MLIRLAMSLTTVLLMLSPPSQADAFAKINDNGLDHITTNGFSRQYPNPLTAPRLNISRRSDIPVYSPLLNRAVYRTEDALMQGVRRLGELPQASNNDVIRVRRQSYSHLERELQQGIRSQFQKISF